MLLKEANPMVAEYLTQNCLVTIFGKTRQTVSNWMNRDVNDLPYRLVLQFSKLEKNLISMCEELKEEVQKS